MVDKSEDNDESMGSDKLIFDLICLANDYKRRLRDEIKIMVTFQTELLSFIDSLFDDIFEMRSDYLRLENKLITPKLSSSDFEKLSANRIPIIVRLNEIANTLKPISAQESIFRFDGNPLDIAVSCTWDLIMEAIRFQHEIHRSHLEETLKLVEQLDSLIFNVGLMQDSIEDVLSNKGSEDE